MRGALALIGDPEPGPDLDGLDRSLVAATGLRRPRVVVLCAGQRGPDEVTLAAQPAVERFRRLGADVEAAPVAGQAAADDIRLAQAVGEADLIWIAPAPGGGLLEVLRGSLVGASLRMAHERGVLVAGCAAAASGLGVRAFDAGVRLGLPIRWRPGLGLLGGVAIVVDYDRRPEPLRALALLLAPRGITVVGIDGRTALLGRGDAWQVHGAGRVTVWRGRRRERHRRGDVVQLADGDPDPPDED